MNVNPIIPLPKPPHKKVDYYDCEVCGAEYREHRTNIRFSDGCSLVRRSAKAQGISGGGFRSRRVVLWAMRVLKMQDWFEEHMFCRD